MRSFVFVSTGHLLLRSIWILSDHRAKRGERLVDIPFRMIGANLEANLLVAARHHGKIETRSEYAVLAQSARDPGRASGIAQHERHDRMIAGDGFKTELREPCAEARSRCLQPTKERASRRA